MAWLRRQIISDEQIVYCDYVSGFRFMTQLHSLKFWITVLSYHSIVVKCKFSVSILVPIRHDREDMVTSQGELREVYNVTIVSIAQDA
jgi:hypothetical protein